MAHDNWQQIRSIFDDAIRQRPEEQMHFVEQACSGDDILLGEVTSLLDSFQSAQSFMETPAVTKVADLIEPAAETLETGTCFGHYEIIELIGTGGMGAVYLARDKKLDRKVAVKILDKGFSRHDSNANRFTQEARAASALNHPNILVIHEIGESDKNHYIVSEFVDGKTLREILKERRLELSEVLDICVQIANALVAAHEAKIIHRDIKPENIMIRPDGFAKILDFGLAKLVERKDKSLFAPIKAKHQTAKGLILGTVNYMSPEQAKGESVDERSDIFSFGVLVYEMIAGRTPFVGESNSETFANLINSEPQPLQADHAVPERLRQLIFKLLMKDRDARSQEMNYVLAELRKISENPAADPLSKDTLFNDREDAAAAEITSETLRPTAQTLRRFSSSLKRKPIILAAIAVAIIATGFGLYFSNDDTTERGSTNEEANRLYIQGRNLTERRSGTDAGKAVEYFEQAIKLDPNFVQAYSGMAHAYIASGNLGGGLPREEYEKARDAIAKALELDPNLADGYEVRGELTFIYEWDFAGAEEDWRRAAELDPNVRARAPGAAFLSVFGRFDEAIAELDAAIRMDPNNLAFQRDRGRILYLARRYDEAIIQLRRIVEIDGNFGSAWAWLWLACEMKGDEAEAFKWFMKSQGDSERSALYQNIYANSGWQGVRRKQLEIMKQNDNKPGSNYYRIARLCTLIGEKEQAFEYLNKALEKRNAQVVMLNVEPAFDGLRDDPRFDELVRRVGLK